MGNSQTSTLPGFSRKSQDQSEDFKDFFQLPFFAPPELLRGKQVHEYDYWKFWDKRLDSYEKASALKRVLLTSLASKYVSFSFAETGIVFAHRLAIVIDDRASTFAVLQSNVHGDWSWKNSSTIGGVRINYSLSDAFETFPFPSNTDQLETIGQQYYQCRQSIMLSRQEGLTDTYNRFHDRACKSADILELRDLHVEMDRAVAAAYSWDDIPLEHGFHETKQGLRYAFSDSARRRTLDRLLALNHQRHANEEVGKNKASTPKPANSRARKIRAAATSAPEFFTFGDDMQ